MDHRVRELQVQVRAPLGSASGARTAAERFSRTVLERVGARLDAEVPDRLVFMRSLSLKWRLDERQLEDSAVVERCAGDVLSRVRGVSPLRIPVSATETADDLVVFDDEAHWRAAHLLASATGGHAQAWFFKSLEAEGDPLRSLAAPARRAFAWKVLERLAMVGRLVEVIAKTRRESATALATQLLHDTESAPVSATVEAFAPATSSPPDALTVVTRSLPRDLPPPVAALVLHAHARTLPRLPREAIESAVQQCLARFRQGSSRHTPVDTDSSDIANTGATVPVSPSTFDFPSQSAIEQEPLPETRKEETEPNAPITDYTIVPTCLGGLFYLLNPALELALGEILWKACLPEQKVFAHAAAALVGATLEDDAGVPLFAGADPDSPIPTVSEDQLNEVSNSLLIALCAALPRRGLAQFPQTILSLEHQGEQPLLVARPVSSPFAIFARPAPTPDAAQAAVAAFLADWSRSAPMPLATPGLAELDMSGRVGTKPQDLILPAVQLVETQSASTTALLAQTISTLGYLLQARAGSEETTSVDAFVARHLHQPAGVRVSGENLTVVMPLEAIQVELRRAGLDRDPGWVPWLHKTVRFEFEGD